MLEKIGLPAKPSVRGNNWVVDASHCQGCSSQFTFINRKHHCRRCGGLFCGSCTQQRMVLRGQGDSPVRICEPCKQLEEAARFEMRYGHKSRAGKGSLKSTSKFEDDVLNQILGSDTKEISSSRQESNTDMISSIQQAVSSASSLSTLEFALDGGEERRRHSGGEPSHVDNEMGSTSPEELRQRALDEKKRYKTLKEQGKSDEALKAFKRGKELERQADALEISIRRNRRKALSSGNTAEIQNKGSSKEFGRKGKEKDDLTAELRELGWSDMDLHGEDKQSAGTTLEGELSSLLGDISGRTNKIKESSGIDKTQVVAHKRKALALKREGKLTEAKEELKKAKVLEKQLEEQELLGVDEDSDDEISALIRSMENEHQEKLSNDHLEHDLGLDHIMGTADDLGVDSNMEVTDADLANPEIVATLKSFGWTDDADDSDNIMAQSAPIDRESLQTEILSLKREALNKKRAGNAAEAMTLLKKAKLLERDLESMESEVDNSNAHNLRNVQRGLTSQNVTVKNDVDYRPSPKSRLTIQKELLAIKKKALALRREGRLDEAEEELKKGRVLEQQLEELDSAPKSSVSRNDPSLVYDHLDIPGSSFVGDDAEEDVTNDDMHDPSYLSLLKNLGWKDGDNEVKSSASKPSRATDKSSVQTTDSLVTIPVRTSRKSRAEIQRELLGLKRKALALRREGKTDEAEEVLTAAKELETQMAELETGKKETQVESGRSSNEIFRSPLNSAADEGNVEDVTENDMRDPALISVLKSMGWKDEEQESLIAQGKLSEEVSVSSVHLTQSSITPSSSTISAGAQRSNGEIQRELLGLKRKALALRRKGEIGEAEELLKMAKVLEAQMEEQGAQKEVILPDIAKGRLESSESLTNAKLGDLNNTGEVNEKSTAVLKAGNEKVGQSLIGSGSKEGGKTSPLELSDSLIPVTSQPIEGNQMLIGELGNAGQNEGSGFVPPPHQSANLMDLLTGDDWRHSQISSEIPVDNVCSDSDVTPHEAPAHAGSLESPLKNLVSEVDVTTKMKEEMINTNMKPQAYGMNSAQGLASQENQNSLRQEVLLHKRKAVALKREGKLLEAREELRQAKLLEKNLVDETPEPGTGKNDPPASVTNAPPHRKEPAGLNSARKVLSGRDRFKLQQESLSHKRQALKLRRDGRMEEAEAEFELAKALEAQLEESSSEDPAKSSNVAEPGDVVVEDFLDPQLLSALRAIGIEDANVVSQAPEKPGPAKVIPRKTENVSEERIQLEEQIKAEKVKAVNLKRAGKQAEALDALRRAKLYEKKLNSLASYS